MASFAIVVLSCHVDCKSVAVSVIVWGNHYIGKLQVCGFAGKFSLELGGGLGEKLEMANSIYCCCDCCMHCTHVSCKKVLFGPGGSWGKMH